MPSPSLVKRARLALQVFRRGIPYPLAGRKSMPMQWPAWREGIPQWQLVDLQSYVDEGFNVNSVIYSAVMYKARAITAAPLRAYGGDPAQPEPLPPKHELSKLALRPNPWQSNAAFMQQGTVFLNIAGNSYCYLDRPRPDATPTAMKWLRPDRIYIVPENGGVKGYLYVPEGRTALNAWQRGTGPKPEGVVPILPQDMLHVKLPNPGDPLEGVGYGLSPVSPLARSADVDNAITKFLQLFFQRGTNVGYLLKYDRELEQSEVDRIRERWKTIYGGWENWDEVGILDNGASLDKLQLGFNEIGFEAMDQRSEARMLGPFGVPPILIGARIGLKQATMANYAESRRQCWEDTIIPELQLYESEVDYYLTGKDADTFLRFDTSQVPALRADMGKQVESAVKLWSTGVPINQAAKIVGLAMDSVKGGDIGYLPFSMQPVGTPRPVPVQGQPQGEQPPEGEPEQPPAKPADQTVEGGAAATTETRQAGKEPRGKRHGKAMTPADWQDAYAEGVPHWAEDLTPSLFAQQFVEEVREAGAGRRVLEIGCGNGRDSILFARAGLIVSAVDAAPGAIDLARENAEAAEVQIDLRVANAEQLPFADAAFDAVFSLSVLHASNLAVSIPETARVLAVGGGLALIYLYGDTTFADGRVETYTTVADFLDLLKVIYEVLDFYSEQEAELDEYGEKHRILVAHLKRVEAQP